MDPLKRRAFPKSRRSASENFPVSPHTRLAVLAALSACCVALTGCGGSKPLDAPDSSKAAAPPESAAEQLLGRVAAAKDARYRASYTLRVKGRADRTVGIEFAHDGSWRFDIPGGAHGGARDVSLVSNAHGIYQCALGAVRSCAKIATPGQRVPPAYDPRLEHPFTDWLDVLSDTREALSVAHDTRLSVPSGDCFSVESNSAAMAPPMDPGIYCFDADGVLTGARFGGRTLVISGAPSKPAKTVKLPGPVTDAKPLPTSPPPPKPSPSKSSSASPGTSPSKKR
jgi:predicted small lipoprotein YifL